jgi:DNA polymerase-3 subunit gamma/tau
VDDLIRLHQGFGAGFDEVVRNGQPRAGLEMLLVRLARRPALIPIDDLVSRLAALEKRLAAGARGAGGPPPGGRTPDPGTSSQGPGRAAVPDGRGRPGGVRSAPEPAPPAEPAPEPPRPPPIETEAAAPAQTAPDSGLDAFRAVVDRIRIARPELAALLNHAQVLRADGERIVLGVEAGSVFERAAKTPECAELLRKAAREHFGTEPVIELGGRNGSGSSKSAPATTVAGLEDRERSDRKREALARAKDHPKLAEVSQILGARLKEIRLPED